MGKLIAMLLALLLVASPAFAEEWRNWGAAPYAASQEEACRKAPEAIAGMDVPEAVKRQWLEQLGTNCAGGETVYLTPDIHLREMWSGGARPHVMRDVPVAAIPVRRSPQGNALREVYQSAKALMWQAEYEGKVYYLYLPLICNNWAWRDVADDCVTLGFNVPVGTKVRWGAGSTTGPFKPDVCNAQREGDGPWTAWWGQCDTCQPAIGYIRRLLGSGAQVFNKYLYPASQTRQTLRFGAEVQDKVVYICLEYPDGRQTCGVYMRPEDWKGRSHVDIPNELFVIDDGNCPS